MRRKEDLSEEETRRKASDRASGLSNDAIGRKIGSIEDVTVLLQPFQLSATVLEEPWEVTMGAQIT